MPAQPIYSLNEAAKAANCSPRELLHAGALGSITLLVGVPDHTLLRLLNEKNGEKETGEPALMRIPNLLVLRREHCLSLELKGKALASDFPLGFSFNPTYGYRPLHPSDCDATLPPLDGDDRSWNDFRRRWTAWTVHEGNPTPYLKLVPERLLVVHTEIDRYFGIDPCKPGNVDEYYKSDFLQYMNQAALRFWGNSKVIKENRRTHPDTREIIDWLVDRGFSKSLAEKAASILRPDFAFNGRPLDDE